jgi:glyoxylase-like metal-dependent hydrolase (beta-lactamase superfamily II)
LVLATREGRIGGVEIGRVLDCSFSVPGATWFPLYDREALKPHEHWLCPDHLDIATGHFPMPVQSFVLTDGRQVVLVDTCVGNDKNRTGPVADFHMLSTPYLARLGALGLTPEDVDFVLCTHLHVDHIGWNTRLENGRWVPTFPNARYVISRVEYEATREAAGRPGADPYLVSCFADSILPVVEAGKAVLVDDAHELLGMLTLRQAPGHSPGSVRIELRSGGELGVFAGDIVHSAVQIPFWQWSSLVCWDPALSAQSRRELLEFCVEENGLLIPGHFSWPHVARIRDRNGIFVPEFGW